jgi:hypothetical protein
MSSATVTLNAAHDAPDEYQMLRADHHGRIQADGGYSWEESAVWSWATYLLSGEPMPATYALTAKKKRQE